MAGDHSRDREVFESVPWEQLVDLRPDRRRWIYAGAGLAVVAVLAFGIARTFRPEPETVLVPPSTQAAPSIPSTTAAPEQSPASTPIPAPTAVESVTPAPGVYSEADLMAAGAGGDVLLSAAVAEWFMIDWFTLDGSSEASTDWPGWSALRPSDEGVRSYVEWLGATRVEEIGPAVHHVEVVVRRLVSPDGATYRRLPVSAYRVVVDLGSGSPVVRDLPSPMSLPETSTEPSWGDPLPDPPEPVVTAAAAVAGGEPSDVLGVWPVDDLWRVVMGVADPSGAVWPESIWLDDDGNVTSPPP